MRESLAGRRQLSRAESPGTVLVTGASGRIGRVIVRECLDRGIDVIAVSRTSRAAVAPEQSAVGRLDWVQADLLEPGGPEAVAVELDQRGFRPESIVHGARNIADLTTPDHGEPSPANWTGEFRLAVVAANDLVVRVARQCPDTLRSVVLLSSMYGIVAVNPNLYAHPANRPPVHYGVVRAAVIQLARELAVRLAPRVRVNAVSFGGVKGRVDSEFERRYAALCPAGRMLRDEDLFGPIAFLMSRASSGTTGQNLIVDGGWTTW